MASNSRPREKTRYNSSGNPPPHLELILSALATATKARPFAGSGEVTTCMQVAHADFRPRGITPDVVGYLRNEGILLPEGEKGMLTFYYDAERGRDVHVALLEKRPVPPIVDPVARVAVLKQAYRDKGAKPAVAEAAPVAVPPAVAETAPPSPASLPSEGAAVPAADPPVPVRVEGSVERAGPRRIPVADVTGKASSCVLYLTPLERHLWESAYAASSVIDGERRLGIPTDPQELRKAWCSGPLREQFGPHACARVVERFIAHGIFVPVGGTSSEGVETYRYTIDPDRIATVDIMRRELALESDHVRFVEDLLAEARRPAANPFTLPELRRRIAAHREGLDAYGLKRYERDYEYLVMGEVRVRTAGSCFYEDVKYGAFLAALPTGAEEFIALPAFPGFGPFRALPREDLPVRAASVCMFERPEGRQFRIVPCYLLMEYMHDSAALFTAEGEPIDAMTDEAELEQMNDRHLAIHGDLLRYFQMRVPAWMERAAETATTREALREEERRIEREREETAEKILRLQEEASAIQSQIVEAQRRLDQLNRR